ncbi:MAG TPA: PspC domain-containing protein [Candidatus Saccharimonadales bacterium]|nr:PspC domain-containing protein [Candidatus Saccharimonadales bacterium]
MNEVTKIHLGRQQFTIAVDAQHELKTYLASIQKKVGDKEVANEVESRMSELLIERGVTGDKVVLTEDVDYLKEQLGTPEDFGDDEDGKTAKESETGARRLFRDTDNAMIAGVGAGLANYFGLDVVVVRLAMAALTVISLGTGIVLYILLWLIVPPATTTSEKLQMRGKSVTLEALKDSVNKADVPNAARRINNSFLEFVDRLFRICIKLVGIGFALFGLLVLAVAAITRIYMSLHDGKLFQENLFPVGSREQLLVGVALGLAVLFSIFLILAGVAVFKRKWPINGWVTGVLAVIFLAGSITSIALAADAVPRVRERFETIQHTTAVKNIKQFDKVVTNGDIDISYISSPSYAANIYYVGHPDLKKVKIYVANKTLYIDSRQLDKVNHCTMLCLYPRYDMTVDVYAPNIQDFKTPQSTDIFYPAVPPAPSSSITAPAPVKAN